MHAHRPVLLALAAALALPAAASAQLPVPGQQGPTGPTGPVGTPTPAPSPAPVPAQAGRLSIQAKAPLRNRGRAFALRGTRVRVTGTLRPAVARERVLVRLNRGKRTLKVRRVRTNAQGAFSVKIRLRKPGRLALRAVHKRSKLIKRTQSKRVRIRTFTPSLRVGSRGPLVRLFQQRLARLAYPAPRNGVFDDATARAVLAWRKVNGFSRSSRTGAKVVRRVLAGKGRYRVRHPRAGHHVEADISRQILALVDGKRVVRVFHTSSGAPATPTVLGRYRFYSKTPGTNAKGMVHSSYFIRGYAIHGYASVPNYNASHGCLRVPVPNALAIYNWIDLGDLIFVER